MNRVRGRVRRRSLGGIGSTILAAVALLLIGSWRAPAEDWQNYRYPLDGFSAAFPSAPDEQTRSINTQDGTIELHGYMLEVDQDALYVSVCDYGSKAQGRNVDKMLESAKQGALQNSQSQLTRESKISLGVYQGVEFESEGQGTHFIVRIYMAGTTMYEALVAYPVGKPYPDAKRFLDSFQLIDRAP